MRQPRKPHQPRMHLFRGAPAVRTWSKHQETVPDWTLCGIARKGASKDTQVTEEAREVSCPYCLQLLAPEWRPGM